MNIFSGAIYILPDNLVFKFGFRKVNGILEVHILRSISNYVKKKGLLKSGIKTKYLNLRKCLKI